MTAKKTKKVIKKVAKPKVRAEDPDEFEDKEVEEEVDEDDEDSDLASSHKSRVARADAEAPENMTTADIEEKFGKQVKQPNPNDSEAAVAVGDELYGGLIVTDIEGMDVVVECPEGTKLVGTEVVVKETNKLVKGNTKSAKDTGTLTMAQAEALKARKAQAEAGIPVNRQLDTTQPGPSGGGPAH